MSAYLHPSHTTRTVLKPRGQEAVSHISVSLTRILTQSNSGMLGRRVGQDTRRRNERRRRAKVHDGTAGCASILGLCRVGFGLLGTHRNRDLARHKEHARGIDVEEALEVRQGQVCDVDTLLNSDLIEGQPVSNQHMASWTSKSLHQHS